MNTARHARWLVATLVAAALGGCANVDDPTGEGVGSTGEDLAVQHVDRITTISYAPNSYVIGNAYPGWTIDVQGPAQFGRGPGNPDGVNYRWGYLFGERFDHCAWIADDAASGTHHESGSRCGSPQEIDTPHFMATYTNGEHNELAGDGSETHMHYAGSGCTDHHGYGNVAPWRVPATPENPLGEVPDGTLLRWRYVSRDGAWVLVRDPSPPADAPNWYFVHRGCVSVANVN